MLCVCVCVREKERKREREKCQTPSYLHAHVYHSRLATHVYICVHVLHLSQFFDELVRSLQGAAVQLEGTLLRHRSLFIEQK